MLCSHRAIEMLIIDVTVLNKARELFFRLFDKRISFTDATTMAVMQQENIMKIITFDYISRGCSKCWAGEVCEQYMGGVTTPVHQNSIMRPRYTGTA